MECVVVANGKRHNFSDSLYNKNQLNYDSSVKKIIRKKKLIFARVFLTGLKTIFDLWYFLTAVSYHSLFQLLDVFQEYMGI